MSATNTQQYARRLEAADARLPDYLVEAIDRSLLLKRLYKPVEHRGHRVDTKEMMNAVRSVVERDPDLTSEIDAVTEMVDYLARTRSSWFGNLDDVVDEEAVASDWRLTAGDLREAYWNGEISTGEMDPRDSDDRKQIAKGVVSVVLEQVSRQRAADAEASVEAAKTAVRNEALTQLYEREAEPAELRRALESAIEDAEEAGWTGA